MVKSLNSEARLPELKSWLCYFLVMQLWTSYITSLCFRLNIYKMGIKTVPFHRVNMGLSELKYVKCSEQDLTQGKCYVGIRYCYYN